MKKWLLMLSLCVMLCIGLMPSSVFADTSDEGNGADTEVTEETVVDVDNTTESIQDNDKSTDDIATKDKAGLEEASKDEKAASESLVEPQDSQSEGDCATDEIQEDTDDGIAVLDATQVINGSGSIDVYQKDSTSSTPEYVLKVSDAPTNTEISLESSHVTLVDQNNNEITDITLLGNLTYIKTDGTETIVSYLMLDDNGKDDDYVLTPYDKDDNALDMAAGKLVIDISGIEAAHIWKIQTNTLCSLDKNGKYNSEIIEAAEVSEPILCDLGEYADGDTVDLTKLAGVSDGDFYYGSIDGTLSLTSCSQAIVQDGELLPVDKNGDPVSDVEIYLAYDQLYSFDVVVNNAVNEHTEDNGDTYLWFGDTFYVDQYHNQGVYLTGYTNNATATEDCGIWPMLGRTREAHINGGAYGFEHWMGQDLNTWEKVKAYDGVSGNDITKSANGKDNGDKNYGIVGPYSFTNGETDVTQSTVRVSGRIGDEFTASEVFGTSDVYMIREDSDHHNEWYNLGSHASDNGKRGWFYWINDFYILNNYQDLLEYLQITEDDTTGEIHLIADEIGESSSGESYDVWDLEGLYTKRDAAVKTYMADNEDALSEQGVGFSEYLGWLDHVQLRMFTTVETVINGVVYNGTLNLMTTSYTPTITYDITCTDIDGSENNYSGSETVTKQNNQECNPLEFDFYINPDEAFNADNVKITLDLGFNGTLYGEDGSTIVYTNSNPFIYNETLTSDQLWEAYDCCPNNTGYDFAVNLSNAVKTLAEDSITLYKIWDDDSNALHMRDNVTSVSVYLERSTDGENWEDVVDESGAKRGFVIHGSSDSDIWSLILTAGDLDLTYDDDGTEKEYMFRLSSEQDIHNLTDNAKYTYTIGEDDLSLTVTNTLETYPIDVTGEKQWLDEDGNALNNRDIPDHVNIALYQDDKFYDMATVTKKDAWSFSFTDLTQFEGDEAHVYTVAELDEDGKRIDEGDSVLLDKQWYEVTGITEDEEAGFVITNTYRSDKDEKTTEGTTQSGGGSNNATTVSSQDNPKSGTADAAAAPTDDTAGTGDDSNMVLWILILITALVIGTVVIGSNRVKQRK